MKKSVKKLVLAKETVISMEASHLDKAAGGISDENVCTYYNSCLRFCLPEPIY
jgi:hypothetical protein